MGSKTLSTHVGTNLDLFFQNAGEYTTRVVDDVGGTASIVVGPLLAISDPGNAVGVPLPLEMFQHATKTFALTVLDDTESPVDLSGYTLRFVAHDENDPTVGLFVIEGAGIAIAGDDNEVANVTVSAAESATANAHLRWKLWAVDEGLVLIHGTLEIWPAVLELP